MLLSARPHTCHWAALGEVQVSAPVNETIAVSEVRVTALVEQVRRAWSTWVSETQGAIVREAEQKGIVNPHFVPTRDAMRKLLVQFYGAASSGR